MLKFFSVLAMIFCPSLFFLCLIIDFLEKDNETEKKKKTLSAFIQEDPASCKKIKSSKTSS